MNTNNTTILTNSVSLYPYGTMSSVTLAPGSGAVNTTQHGVNKHSFNNSLGEPVMTIPSNSNEVIIEPNAALIINGAIVINGIDLEKRLQTIETLLYIPSRDIEIENEFPKLKKLWEEYNVELEKYKTWKRLTDE